MTDPDRRPAVTTEDILCLEGIGWDGDLDEMRNDPGRAAWPDRDDEANGPAAR